MTNAQPLRQMAFKETGYHIKFLFLGITDMETAQYQFQRALRKILLHRTDDIRNARCEQALSTDTSAPCFNTSASSSVKVSACFRLPPT